LQPDDVLVLNNTRVFPARLIGRRIPSGGRIEVLLVRSVGELLWQALVRPGHRVRNGDRLSFDEDLECEVAEVFDGGLRLLRFDCQTPLEDILERIGETPLPPYIKRPSGTTPSDRERYQTVYASDSGAVAAPTAGLHFTEKVLADLRQRGVEIVEITLHVGYGTFEPVRVEEISDHRVAPERFHISEYAAATLNQAKASGRRIIGVGTTTTRALEASVNERGKICQGHGSADLTITPGYKFRAIDSLLTNFHLPRSSLLLLVSAFAGRDLVLNAYRHAVSERYRFFSYGDCMLIL
jgi:S-adenosylmethionine:tRNA ribosyltransferase-isomerase